MFGDNKDSSFSFDDVLHKGKIISPTFFRSTDNIDLAFYEYISENSIASLIFIHGGGAYSGAGYHLFAEKLSKEFNINVYLFDLRGHGNSGGDRGDTPDVNQMYLDFDILIDLVDKKSHNNDIFLGGHSSGGGFLLNYISQDKFNKTKGYIFISPELGYKSGTGKKNIKTPFAKVNILPFILSAFTGDRLFSHKKAVFLNYPKHILDSEPLIINSLTVNMALALTPYNPQKQFAGIDKKIGFYIGGKDELFDVNSLLKYGEYLQDDIKMNSEIKIIEGQTHLGIILGAGDFVGKLIKKWVN